MKQRILAALLCLCLLIVSPCAVLAESKAATTGVVHGLSEGTPLRVRSKPVDGEKVGEVYNGDVVTILATSDDGGWYQIVTPSGVTGWSSAEYIRIQTGSNEPTPMEATGTVYNIDSGSKLYVRQTPDFSAKTLDKLSNDAIVAVLAISADGKWYQVVTPSKITGWCNSAYIRINAIYETDEEFEAYLTAQGFPEDYKVKLRNIYAHHPNWLFKAAHLPMTFAEATAGESVALKNALDIDVSPESWLSMEYGAYNWDTGKYVAVDSGGWVTASPEIIAYHMDPRNFLDLTYIFQFEDLLYSDTHTLAGVQAILPPKYDDYAADLLKAAKEEQISAYFLATRMTQEGSKIDGTWPGYEGYYNFCNIGAYAHSGNGAVTNGAIYAKDKGWDTPYKCLLGSAQFIGKQYIHKQQNTIYYQKFNVAGENLYNHQYMSNVNAPAAESKIRAGRITSAELAGGMTFVIPVYKEMPETPIPKPSEKGNNNNFLDALSVAGCTLTPTFDRYEMEYAADVAGEVTEITITATPNNSAAVVKGAGKVTLKPGENLIPVAVTATSGQVRTYTLTIFRDAPIPDEPTTGTTNSTGSTTASTGSTKPTESTDSTSSTGTGDTTDSTGSTNTSGSTDSTDSTKPTESTDATSSTETTTTTTTTATTTTAPPTPIITGTTYVVGKAIVGVEPGTTVKDFIAALKVKNGTAKVISKEKEKTEGVLATGDVVQLYDSKGKLNTSYPVHIFGEVNGDGKISAIDLRMIQKHILDITKLTDHALSAADVNGDGKTSTIDLRMIQKFILGLTDSLQKEKGGTAQ